MCLVDIALWFASQGEAMGLHRVGLGHEWLRYHLGEALGWAEFALLTSLSCDYLTHLGVDQVEEAGKSTRSLAATGAVIWMLLFCEQTDWSGGWPLHGRPIRHLEALLLSLGSTLIWTITLFQVTAMTISATRHSNEVLVEIDREDASHELLVLPSESSDAFQASTTAGSESWRGR
jgi:hypothetical protein